MTTSRDPTKGLEPMLFTSDNTCKNMYTKLLIYMDKDTHKYLPTLLT